MAKLDDLVKMIDGAISLLQKNEEWVTPQFLKTINDLLAEAKNPTVVAVLIHLLKIDAKSFLDSIITIENIIAKEREFIANGSATKFIRILNNIKNRPLLLRAIAAIL